MSYIFKIWSGILNAVQKKGIVFLIFLFLIPSFVNADVIDDLKKDLENQIEQKQQEINQYENNINQNQQKSKTLENDINILEDQINKIRIELNQFDLIIQKSTLNIQGIDQEINILKDNVNQKKDLLSEYLRTMARCDDESLLEVILKNEKFSDFFDELNALENVQEQIHGILMAVNEIKGELQNQKDELEGEREEQNRLKSFQLSQQRNVENKQWQKEDLLDKTKGEDIRYQQLIESTGDQIVYIKEQISLLEKYNLTLEEAVQNAIFAATKTGIRPAFLLGVLESESRLGLNVGTGTYYKDMYLCYHSLGKITQANKEKNAFLQICEELGLNPDTQPVSAEPWYGCGGAMGVAQFIPTTWMAYRDRIAELTGHNPPNPWNHRDAFTAAAIKLSNGGANQRTEIGERTAYAKYLGGSRYSRWIWHQYTDKVINLANNFQKQYFE